MKRVTIAIDGPAASGKTTTARAVAARLGYRYIDSGAFYRALALTVERSGVASDDVEAVMRVADGIEVAHDQDGAVVLDGSRETDSLRTPEVSELASRLSVHAPVRDWVNRRLRTTAAGGAVVVEGRDIGSVVLPDADVKIFLLARLDVRTERRHRDLEAAGHARPRGQVAEELRRRDDRDSERDVAPLRVPDGAIVIDGSDLSFDEQVEEVMAAITETAT